MMISDLRRDYLECIQRREGVGVNWYARLLVKGQDQQNIRVSLLPLLKSSAQGYIQDDAGTKNRK